MKCWLDTETRSATPITAGTDRYTDSAECMVVTWALEEGRPQIWDHSYNTELPDELYNILGNESITLTAHNAPFDRAILERALGIPTDIKRWRCTQAKAYAHGLPGSLAILGEVLELPEDERKREDDAKLIQLFCKPRPDGSWATRHTHPAEWERFRGYAINDTIALREIDRRLPSHNYIGEHLRCWWLDQNVNTRGFCFDTKLASAARVLLSKAKDRHDDQVDTATAGAVQAATQRAKLLGFLNASGLALPNMRAATIREWLEHDDLRPEQRFLLELRLEAAKSSGSKYKRGMEIVGVGDRIRYGIQFSGAGRTGRFAGRGFQPHNMARPSMKAKYIEEIIIPGILSGDALNHPLIFGGPNEACSNALRGAIIAALGFELVVADWSNIESRILAWLANEEWKLEAYRAVDRGEGTDLYKLLFSQFFGTPAQDVNDHQRQSGKVSELAFGFGGGVGALVTMAAGYNMDLDALPAMVFPSAKEEHKKKAYKAWRRAFLSNEDYELDPKTYQACDILKQVYRAANKRINDLRHDLDAATQNAIKIPGSVYNVARCTLWSTGSWLIIQLPSGRRLLYSKPRLHSEEVMDADTGEIKVWKYLSYLTARGKSWRRERAWSGLFVENIVQAVANDILRAALLHIDDSYKRGEPFDFTLSCLETPIALHVHDEIVCETPVGVMSKEKLLAMMTTELVEQKPWLRGLPLAATGWVGTRYKKA